MHFGLEYMTALDDRHAAYNYEANFWKLAAKMRIPVVQGDFNSSVFVPHPLITLEPGVFFSELTFTRFHELAHTVLKQSGIQEKLRHEAESPEQYRAWVEAYCNFGAAQFQMPNPLLERVLRRYGFTPAAVMALVKVGGVDISDAMERLTNGFLEPDAERVTFLLQGSYLLKVVNTSPWFPHQEGDRIPEIALSVENSQLLRLPRRFGYHHVLGVAGW